MEYSKKPNSSSRLFQNLAYASPQMALFVFGPFSLIPGIYVKYFGLSLGAIAIAKILTRIIGWITEPAIGFLSDRYQRRFGTRKPLVIVGAFLLLVTSTMLYIPYGWDSLSPEPISFLYFLFFLVAFSFSSTLMNTPHLTWGVELTRDVKGRSQRFSFRSMASFTSLLLFFCIPLLPIFETTEVTPETLSFAVYLSWVFMPLCLFICMRWVSNPIVGRAEPTKNRDTIKETKAQRFKKARELIFGNKPLMLFYLANTLISLGYSMSNGLTFFYIDNYLRIADKLPFTYMVSFAICIPAVWFWGVLAQKIGAQFSWLMGMSLCAMSLFCVSLIDPGESSFWPFLICKAFIAAGFSSCMVAGYMVLANITDYGKWKYHQDCSGIYFALRGTLFKFTAAVGVAMGLLISQWLGFNATATELPASGSLALRLSHIGLPVIILLVSIAAISLIPISTSQHEAIRKRLLDRDSSLLKK